MTEEWLDTLIELCNRSTCCCHVTLKANEACLRILRPHTFECILSLAFCVAPLRQRRNEPGWPSRTYTSSTCLGTSLVSGVPCLSWWEPGSSPIASARWNKTPAVAANRTPWMVRAIIGGRSMEEGVEDSIAHCIQVTGMATYRLTIVPGELDDRRLLQFPIHTSTERCAGLLPLRCQFAECRAHPLGNMVHALLLCNLDITAIHAQTTQVLVGARITIRQHHEEPLLDSVSSTGQITGRWYATSSLSSTGQITDRWYATSSLSSTGQITDRWYVSSSLSSTGQITDRWYVTSSLYALCSTLPSLAEDKSISGQRETQVRV